MCHIFCILLLLSAHAYAELRELSEQEISLIGNQIWKNECNQTISGLISWNEGEKFASLGIGHFIWYPTARKGYFVETFPALIAFFEKHEVSLPRWLTPKTACPWHTKEAFEKEKKSPRINELRTLLTKTIPLQARFIAERFKEQIPKLTRGLPSADAAHVQLQIERLSSVHQGIYALIDYLNFKGDGTNPSERYQDRGWGLLQVLLQMPGNTDAPIEEFVASAKKVLATRIELAPAERGEERWLAGWLNRLDTYR